MKANLTTPDWRKQDFAFKASEVRQTQAALEEEEKE